MRKINSNTKMLLNGIIITMLTTIAIILGSKYYLNEKFAKEIISDEKEYVIENKDYAAVILKTGTIPSTITEDMDRLY